MAKSRDLKVGIFVFAGLCFVSLAVFLVGDERRVFARAEHFYTQFSDVQGLKPGAPVRMGGIDIGTVKSVGYKTDAPNDPNIYVTLDVVASEMGRIRSDSEAKVANKGLLGDKMIEITRGKGAGKPVKPGSVIRGIDPEDMFAKVGPMTEKASDTIDNLHKITATIASDKFQKDLSDAMASVTSILGNVANGDGYPSRFLKSTEEADRISRTFDSFDRVSRDAAGAMGDVRRITSRVESGPGFTHDVIFGAGPSKEVAQFGSAAEEFALTLRGVREGKGFLRDLLYGGQEGVGNDAASNMVAITGDLRAIVSDVRKGKGTIGALLVDPSIYEDLKSVLGNVERNDVMRALVRFSIKQDASKKPVRVTPDAASPK